MAVDTVTVAYGKYISIISPANIFCDDIIVLILFLNSIIETRLGDCVKFIYDVVTNVIIFLNDLSLWLLTLNNRISLNYCFSLNNCVSLIYCKSVFNLIIDYFFIRLDLIFNYRSLL